MELESERTPKSDMTAASRRVAGAVDFLDQWLAYQRWYLELPSLAVGISVGDETLLATGHGFADVDARLAADERTRYRIASHSKVFTATALAQLADAGQLQLDDPVSQYVDWFRSATHDDLEHVTIRQLLSHSSGITRDGTTLHWHDDQFPSLDEIVEQMETGAEVFGAVEKLKYSNVGLTVAGQVIEAVTGVGYDQHITSTILEPLGLTSTTTSLPDDLHGHALGYPPRLPGRARPALAHVDAGVMDSATGFSSNVVDLLRWYQAHRLGSGELLPDRWKREMQRVQFEGSDARWGLGFAVSSHGGLDFVTHGGGYPGFITYSGLNQRHELAVVVLTNSLDGPAWGLFDGIAKILGRALDGQFDAPASSKPDDIEAAATAAGEDTAAAHDRSAADDLAAAQDSVGLYEERWRVHQLAVIGDRVVLNVPRLPDPTVGLQVLESLGGGRFRIPDTPATGSPGEIVELEPGDSPTLRLPAVPPLQRADASELDTPPW